MKKGITFSQGGIRRRKRYGWKEHEKGYLLVRAVWQKT
jgi:hypothetical protein